MESSNGFTLTRFAYIGRLTIKFGSILLVTLMIGRVFLTAAIQYWVATHPQPPPPPTVGFGPLPPLRFPSRDISEKPTAYQLETATGGFPVFGEYGDRMKVYLMKRSTANLLGDERARQAASQYGYVFEPTVLSDRTYRWTKSLPLQSTLQMDIQNLNFSIDTNFLSKPELLSEKNLPSEPSAVAQLKAFVTSGQPLGEDMATSSGKVSYLKALGGDVAPAVSFSDADFLQIDIMRTPIDNAYPFVTSEGEKGILHGIMSGAKAQGANIVHVEYHYHPIDYTERQTYPIRSAAEAWNVLQAGEGFIVNKGTNPTAVVRNVEIAYYDDYEEQDYLQPVYVFTGDGGFMGLVPAISSQWIQVANSATTR